MKTENQPLRLLKHAIESANATEAVIVTPVGRVVLPGHYRLLFELSEKGLSISQMAEELYRVSGEWRFALLGRYLKYLNRAGLLADRNQVLLAQGLEDEKKPNVVGTLFKRLFSGKENSRGSIDKWAELPMIREIEPVIRNELLMRAREKKYGSGEACIKQNSSDRSLFAVLEGKLAVAKSFDMKSGPGRRKVVAFLETGAVFGEAGFFFGHKRTADVVAVEPSRVLEIPFDDRMKNIEIGKASALQTRIWFLQVLHSNAQFSSLPGESLDALLHVGERKDFRAGEKIIQEGESADACYFIVQGRASVSQNTIGLGKLQNGDVFGEIALMKAGTLRTATVIAETDVFTVRVDGLRFWNLLKMNLPLAIEVEKIAKRRLAEDRSRLADR
jgi:CRP-like cAMP-binding protein